MMIGIISMKEMKGLVILDVEYVLNLVRAVEKCRFLAADA